MTKRISVLTAAIIGIVILCFAMHAYKASWQVGGSDHLVQVTGIVTDVTDLPCVTISTDEKGIMSFSFARSNLRALGYGSDWEIDSNVAVEYFPQLDKYGNYVGRDIAATKAP